MFLGNASEKREPSTTGLVTEHLFLSQFYDGRVD